MIFLHNLPSVTAAPQQMTGQCTVDIRATVDKTAIEWLQRGRLDLWSTIGISNLKRIRYNKKLNFVFWKIISVKMHLELSFGSYHCLSLDKLHGPHYYAWAFLIWLVFGATWPCFCRISIPRAWTSVACFRHPSCSVPLLLRQRLPRTNDVASLTETKGNSMGCESIGETALSCPINGQAEVVVRECSRKMHARDLVHDNPNQRRQWIDSI